jgi:hypothetical protein
MTKHLTAAILGVSLAAPLLSSSLRVAQQKKTAAPATSTAPIPGQILTAKRVFIANGGGDESRYEAVSYSGGPQRAYNEFYVAMQSWGRFDLVTAPADADLIFEIRLIVFQIQRERVMADDTPASDSQLRFVIRDARTQQTLWGLTAHAQGAVLQSNRDKNFEQALAAIVAEVRRIAGSVTSDPAKN